MLCKAGTTFQNYRGADNQPGEFQFELAVYGREGQPRRRCVAGHRAHRHRRSGHTSVPDVPGARALE